MLGRVALVLLGAAGAAAACGGSDFQAHAGGAGSGATAGVPDSATGGTPDQVGGGNAGAPVVEAGAPGEAGAGGVAGAAPLPPSIQIVQVSRTSVLGNVEPTLTLSKLPQAGNSLIVGITCFSDIDNCLIPAEGGVSDNQNNTYLLVKEGASIVSSETHGSRPYLFIAENIPAPSGMLTITVDPNGTADQNVQNFVLGALEVAGLAAQDSVDQVGDVPNSCCEPMTTVTTDSPTLQANELAVAVHTARSSDNDFAYMVETGWTQQHVNEDGLSLASQHSLVTRVLTEPGTVSHTWTHHEPTRGVSAIIATFRGAAP